ncbi:Protein root UVB sensitive 3, partial [Mucuna pruriens]
MEPSSSVSNKTITLEEWNGSSPTKLSKTFTIKASSSSVTITRSGARFTHGFPSSVTADYVPFQIWDSLQGLSTYIRTMLSTQALLSAIGVGEKSATVIGATFQGSNLDSNAKMWRLVADLMNDLGFCIVCFAGMLMDLVSPLFPSAFVFIVCLGSISRSFTGVASGATRAALTQHFALQDNAADISAKEGSQETLATMIGMVLGMLVARITIGHPLAIWFSFLSLTVFHMYANYRAVRCLALNSLNPERSSILLQHFMETGQVLSPEQVSSQEHVLPIPIISWSSKNASYLHKKVRLGMRISSFGNTEIKEHLLSAAPYYTKAKYLLVERKGILDVIVHKDSNAADVLKSFFHALVLAMNVHKSKSLHSDGQNWIDNQYEVFIQKVLRRGPWQGATRREGSPQ